MTFTLPKTVEIGGKEYAIRYDFRVILEIIVMLNDPELTDDEKVEAIIEMFYFDDVPFSKEAVEACFSFIDGGRPQKNKKQPRLLDWEQDFEYIIAPVNRVLGFEARAVDYDIENNTGGVHWWTFLGAYMEIGSDCLFSQIVSLRDKQARGEKLEKHERKWLKRNNDIVQLKQHFSATEDDLIKEWTKGVTPNG